MTKEDTDKFIRIMKEIREDWTPEQVEETYGDVTLAQALKMRLTKINTFYEYVEEVVIPDAQRLGLWKDKTTGGDGTSGNSPKLPLS